ncbi:hypothetical protein BB560_003109 [Smittium megazygosporum]|uniref:AMP-dependent synthetase/ligase domain-containing protein n=1 Tax=Smittium megazygosporum TaxID=133381 RepID=A0A2T9ZCV8_9FUNG|nr:hypothetical protein BB560_003109 [Smittium megazygosporum]
MESNTVPQTMWTPKDVKGSAIYKFMQYANQRYGKNMDSYDSLHTWSVTELEEFWGAVWDYCGIKTHTPYTRILDTSKRMDEIPEWFEGVSINFAENVLESRKHSDRVAIYARGEQKHKQVTFRELYSLVSNAAESLQALGVVKGDRVAACITNCAETIILFLACASIGAIWSCAPVEFGVNALVDRFAQITPKVYISLDESTYNGKTTSLVSKNKQVLKQLPSVTQVVIIQNNPSSGDVSKQIPGSITWDQFLQKGRPKETIDYELVSFSYPIFIVFSSGTTGRPKCIAHRTGGYLLMSAKNNKVAGGLTEEDVFFYYTTTGWIMWNSLPGALLCGCSVVTFEGSPLVPKTSVLWDMVDEIKITRFGTSPKYLQSLEDKKYYPKDHHSLESIKSITTTGSPLKPNNYDFVYSKVKKDVFLSSISGGTELAASFVGGISTLPIYKGEIQHMLLGMAVECWDENGNRVVGKSGDLVCTKPFPTMPAFFWGDDEQKTRYKGSYFHRFPGVWFHGDFMKINPKTKGILMLGRSDGTLNPNGVRFGSSDIYNIVESIEEVEDSLVIGQQIDQFERVLLFIKLFDPKNTDIDALKVKIATIIREKLSARHVPEKIISVDRIPYTGNGKKVEIAVKLLLNKMYTAAQEYAQKNPRAQKKEIIEYVKKNVVIDEKTIQSVEDPSSISQFLQMDDLMFRFNIKPKM